MQIRAIRSLCYTLVIALLTTLMPAPFTQPASAQLMPTYSVGVIDFVNESGVQGDLLARLATDAVVVEMSKSNRYDVSITRTMMNAKMDELGLRSPLTKLDLVRLGEVLSADAMLQGAIRSVQLAGSGATRRASVTIVAQMIDQASGETINGAVQTGTSVARVGYTADDNALIAEAINSAAYLTVKTMVDYVIPEATVMMNVGESQVMINKGVRAGIKPGMRMIVLRNREIIGYIEVTGTSPDDAYATVLKSMRGIQPEDKARAIYEMPMVSSSLKSAPLPSGAPRKSHVGGGAGSKIAKFLIGIGVVAGLASLFVGGSGVSSAPKIGTGSNNLEFTWKPSLYNHGQNVHELQLVRDAVDALDGSIQPVAAIRDSSLWNLGRIDVAGLYGGAAGVAVTYNRLDLGASTPTVVTWTVPPEPYGITHTYNLRAILRTTGTAGSDGPTYKYQITKLGSQLRATAVEPVTRDRILTPFHGDPLYISQLRTGDTNLTWLASLGATQYQVVVEPIRPGSGPTWKSNIIYAGAGTEVSLSDVDRLDLARALDRPNYVDIEMRWRVEVRNEGDTSPLWTYPDQSQWPIFRIGGTPGGPPG